MSLNLIADYYIQYLIPTDATLSRKLLSLNAKLSQDEGWTSIATRIFMGPLSIPAALLDCAKFAIIGLDRSAQKLLDGEVNEAQEVLKSDIKKSLKCLVLSVSSVAYTVLGILLGAEFYREFNPVYQENIDVIRKQQEEIKALKILNKQHEKNYGRAWELTQASYSQRMIDLEETFNARALVLESEYRKRETNLETLYNKKLEEAQEEINDYKEEFEEAFIEKSKQLEDEYKDKQELLNETHNQVCLLMIERGLKCMSALKKTNKSSPKTNLRRTKTDAGHGSRTSSALHQLSPENETPNSSSRLKKRMFICSPDSPFISTSKTTDAILPKTN